jgi:hypothetical protein
VDDLDAAATTDRDVEAVVVLGAAVVRLAGARVVALVIGRNAGRDEEAAVDDGAISSAVGRLAARLMPTATAVQPTTASAAAQTENTRPADM